MKIATTNERKAISPIIATVLVIAATLIAFAAVAGYMFGLFGSSTSSAQAQVVSSSLSASSCQLTVKFTNNGGQSVTVTSASFTAGSASYTSTGSTTSITPGAQTTIYLTFGSCTSLTAGQVYSVTMDLSNGITATVTPTAQ